MHVSKVYPYVKLIFSGYYKGGVAAVNTKESANVSIILDIKCRGYGIILLSEVLHSSLFPDGIG